VNQSFLLALTAGVVGIIVGRALPRGAPSPPGTIASAVPTSLATAPPDCNADRAQLASTRTQLAICMAYRLPPAEAKPASSSPAQPAASASASPQAALVHPGQASVLAMLTAAESLPHVEFVIVQHKDGTIRGYRTEDWLANRDDGQIIARESPGRAGYYVVGGGPDAGPVSLHDLAGPDGVIKMGGLTVRFQKKPDAGGAGGGSP